MCWQTASPQELAERGLAVPAEWSYYGVDPDAMSPVGYLEFAAPRIAQAIARAWENRRPGGVNFGLGHAVVSHNRLVTYDNGRSQQFGRLDRPDFSHIEGYEDHSVGLLYTFDAGGELTGVVVNVPCSALGFGSRITADFWHETRNEMRKRFGESFYTLQQVASSGEQWPRVLVDRRAHERMLKIAGRTSREEIAMRLADAVASVLPSMRDHIEWDPVFAHRVEQVALTQLRVTEEMAESRRQQFERLFSQYRTMREEIDANPEIRNQPRWFEKISGVYWQMDRADRVVQTFTVQTADGHYRYLPTARSLAGSAYGAVPESIVFGPEGGRELVDRTLELIASLWAERSN